MSDFDKGDLRKRSLGCVVSREQVRSVVVVSDSCGSFHDVCIQLKKEELNIVDLTAFEQPTESGHAMCSLTNSSVEEHKAQVVVRLHNPHNVCSSMLRGFFPFEASLLDAPGLLPL